MLVFAACASPHAGSHPPAAVAAAERSAVAPVAPVAACTGPDVDLAVALVDEACVAASELALGIAKVFAARDLALAVSFEPSSVAAGSSFEVTETFTNVSTHAIDVPFFASDEAGFILSATDPAGDSASLPGRKAEHGGTAVRPRMNHYAVVHLQPGEHATARFHAAARFESWESPSCPPNARCRALPREGPPLPNGDYQLTVIPETFLGRGPDFSWPRAVLSVRGDDSTEPADERQRVIELARACANKPPYSGMGVGGSRLRLDAPRASRWGVHLWHVEFSEEKPRAKPAGVGLTVDGRSGACSVLATD